MTTIEPGSTVLVRTADDKLLERRAVSAPVMGEDFAVVWVTRPEEWTEAELQGREPSAVPWPAQDVLPGVDATA
jgi:hypothetical protein